MLDLNFIVEALKIVVTVAIFFVWFIRYDNIRKEFRAYGFPRWFRDLVGILKISFTVMLQFDDNNLVVIGSLGIIILMLGAVATHIKVKNPIKDVVPAITMLSIGLIIFLHAYAQSI